MGKIIGIDLGTTFSLIAYMDAQTGSPKCIPGPYGSTLCPSVVSVDRDGKGGLTMGKRRAARLLAGLAAAVLAGCTTDIGPTPAQLKARWDAENIFPQNYRQDLLAFLRTYLNDPTQVRLPKHNHVVETFPSDRADEPFRVRILPRRTRGNGFVPDAHRS